MLPFVVFARFRRKACRLLANVAGGLPVSNMCVLCLFVYDSIDTTSMRTYARTHTHTHGYTNVVGAGYRCDASYTHFLQANDSIHVRTRETDARIAVAKFLILNVE